ncbi:MAG: hypothetical protein J5779_02975 [Clostridia bacterium]|nr:hypothetical protein [Clostridia bacterium]
MNSIFLRFICFSCVVFSFFAINIINFDPFEKLNAHDIQFYFSSLEEISDLEFQKNGVGYSVNADENYKIMLQKNYDGFCFKTKLNFDEIKKILNFEVKNMQKLENFQIFYAYSAVLQKYCLQKNLKINLQLVVFNDYILVGCPVLLGSY